MNTERIETEIEGDLLERARAVYPTAKNKNELVRRVFERGVRAREVELDEPLVTDE